MFFWILTQILSVCPLLCYSHDSACRRNSRRQEKRERRREREGGSAQGLQVEERGEREGALKVAEMKEGAGGREGEMEGGMAVVISESVPDSH